MKFKVGDKVKVIGGTDYHCFPIWSEVEILRITKNGNYVAYGIMEGGEKGVQTIIEGSLELVKDDTQVKHHAPIVYEVYEELKKHIGKENAISAHDLCEIFQDELAEELYSDIMILPKDRKLRKIMREIRRSTELEKIPCSCKKGYYMARTKEEAQKAIDRLVNTAKNELKTAYTMAKKLGLDGQMKIQFGKYWKDTYHSIMEKEDETDTETD